MRVTTLIENRPSKTGSHLVAEWGLSLHITFNGHNILFDTGSSGSFAKNAVHLSVNVASIDTAVLSHHHFDHGGGLRCFLDANANAKVYLGEAPNGECFIRLLPFIKKYIGLEKALMTDYPERFKTVSTPTEILPDVFVFPHISGRYPTPAGNKRLLVRRDGKLTPDDFAHEILMAIKENNKLIIFTGCSHNGVLNNGRYGSQSVRGNTCQSSDWWVSFGRFATFQLHGRQQARSRGLCKEGIGLPNRSHLYWTLHRHKGLCRPQGRDGRTYYGPKDGLLFRGLKAAKALPNE
jgi:metal-dependent hydrolase (beta-lactamase superfamily II)